MLACSPLGPLARAPARRAGRAVKAPAEARDGELRLAG
jgi:hypothetical protein